VNNSDGDVASRNNPVSTHPRADQRSSRTSAQLAPDLPVFALFGRSGVIDVGSLSLRIGGVVGF